MQLDMQFVQCKSSSHFPNGFLVDAVVRQAFQLHEFLVKLFNQTFNSLEIKMLEVVNYWVTYAVRFQYDGK